MSRNVSQSLAKQNNTLGVFGPDLYSCTHLVVVSTDTALPTLFIQPEEAGTGRDRYVELYQEED